MKKRVIAAILALCICLLMTPVTARAVTTPAVKHTAAVVWAPITSTPKPDPYTTPSEQMIRDAMEGVLILDNVNMRKGPGTNYEVVYNGLKKGAQLTVYLKDGKWFFVKVNSTGTYGYIHEQYMTITTTPPPSTPRPDTQEGAYVTISGLKNKLSVWKEASKSTSRLGYAYNGDVFELLAVKGEWYMIRYGSKTGYVTGEHVFATNEHLVPHESIQPERGPTITPQYQYQSQAYVTIVNVKNKLSVRKDASPETKRLGYAYNGETYPLIAVKGKWYKIQYQANVVGYVHEDYVRATNEYLVPHMTNEWETYTPKPTPTKEVYITEPPVYVTEPPAEVIATQPGAEVYVPEPQNETHVTDAPPAAIPDPNASTDSQPEQDHTDPPVYAVVESEPEAFTEGREEEDQRKEASAAENTKRPSSRRRTYEDEDEEDEEADTRMVVVLLGIGGVLAASLVGVAAILIHRHRTGSRRSRDW